MFTPDNNRIFGLLVFAFVVSIVFGYSLESATLKGKALGAQFYIGGPVVAFLIQLWFFKKFNLFDQGLSIDKDDVFNHPIETISSEEEIENMIIELKAKTQRINNRINRLENAKEQFDEKMPQAAFKAMGFNPARRGG